MNWHRAKSAQGLGADRLRAECAAVCIAGARSRAIPPLRALCFDLGNSGPRPASGAAVQKTTLGKRIAPSPGTPGEGRGGGLFVPTLKPPPYPPPEYRERENERRRDSPFACSPGELKHHEKLNKIARDQVNMKELLDPANPAGIAGVFGAYNSFLGRPPLRPRLQVLQGIPLRVHLPSGRWSEGLVLAPP